MHNVQRIGRVDLSPTIVPSFKALTEGPGGKLSAFEIKWKKKGFKTPPEFAKAYPGVEVQLIHQENISDFVS